jgi:NAD(P)H-flavin reductase
MLPEPFRVRSRRQETDDTWTLELEPPDGREPRFEPGQFNMLYAFGVGEVPISICGEGSGESLEHTVRAVGGVTETICATEEGDTLGVRGPFGSSWPVVEAEGGDLVIVAGGIGLPPLRPALLRALANRDLFRSVILLYGGRAPDQLVFRPELDAWDRLDELELGLTVDSATAEWRGTVGVVPKLIEGAPFEPGRTTALMCGPEVMMRFAIRALLDRGVSAESIHLSMERNMKCAIAQCGHCQFGPTFDCREGPVFRYSNIQAWLGIREL